MFQNHVLEKRIKYPGYFTRFSPKKIVLFITALWLVTVAQAQVPKKLWGVEGTVYSVVHSGDTIYIGGSFTKVGPNNQSGLQVDLNTGTPTANYPVPNANIIASIPDGAGGWYIGGFLTLVDDQPRIGVARIDINGKLTNFKAPIKEGTIYCLQLSGNTLYMGGSFKIDGEIISQGLAAVNATTGALLPSFNAGTNNATVKSMALSGKELYIGGAFYTINNTSRTNLAALNAETGDLLSFDPKVIKEGGMPGMPGASADVASILLSGNKLYVGGFFNKVGGVTRANIAAVDITTGVTDATFNPNSNGVVQALAISGKAIYAGGRFTSIGGEPNSNLAALDTLTGSAIAGFKANANASVNAIAITGTSLLAGGGFTTINGTERNFVTALDPTTGAVQNKLEVNPSKDVSSLAVNSDRVYIGGNFRLTHAVKQQNLAALDAKTGMLLPGFAPEVSSSVFCMALSGALYIGGSFNVIGIETRKNIAALDPRTGAVNVSFKPDVNNNVSAMLADGDRLLIGGNFSQINGQAQTALAALDKASGKLSPLKVNFGSFSSVNTMLLSNNRLYLGGGFSINDEVKSLAVVNPITGDLIPSFTGNAVSGVSSMVLSGKKLYIAGFFTQVNSQAQARLAALDTATGNLIPEFKPALNAMVHAVLIHNGILYAGGIFNSFNGQPITGLAIMDTATGSAIPGFSANSSGHVHTLVPLNDQSIYAGGSFSRMNNLPSSGIGIINLKTGIVLPVTLSAFNATRIGNEVKLNWLTSSEQQAQLFTIERSSNGKDFLSIGHVMASDRASGYSYNDPSPLSQTAFYRLAIRDNDGKITHSPIVRVNYEKNATGFISIAPNPASNTIKFTNTNPQLNGGLAVITNLSGQPMKRFVLGAVNTFDISPWPAGMYFIRLADGSSLKFVKD